MSKLINSGALVGTAALLSFFAFGSVAEASNVLNCKGASASKVTSCCEQAIIENGRPDWMVMSTASCKKMTICKEKKCYIHAVYYFGGKSRGDGKGK
jgi:hypothetical protein